MITIQRPWISWGLWYSFLVELRVHRILDQNIRIPRQNVTSGLGEQWNCLSFVPVFRGELSYPFIILDHYMYLSTMANTRCWYTKWHLINYTKNPNLSGKQHFLSLLNCPPSFFLTKGTTLAHALQHQRCVGLHFLGQNSILERESTQRICHWCNWDYMHATSILGTSRKGEHNHIHLDFGCAYKYWIHFLLSGPWPLKIQHPILPTSHPWQQLNKQHLT